MSNHATQQSPQVDELIGRVVNDRFRILSVIARGGMGRVYRAEQVPLGRLVAVKTLDPRQAGGDQDPLFQQRFFLEASVASKLQHPNTVTVFDYGRTADGIYFIAMELVEGRSLYNLIREEGPLDPGRVIHIALQIARSLREAHRLDVIHRDLKPGNVLLTRHGDEEDFVKVLDFGLVKHVEDESEQELTQAGLFMGSPKYMSPEQIRGERVDARSDIYALGVVMYEMLTGKAPFERDNTVKVLMAHMHENVPPLARAGVPPLLADVIQRCLQKLPEHRPSSMDDIIMLLKQVTGAPLMMSGQYPLSQEFRLPGTASISGALPAQTVVSHMGPQVFPSVPPFVATPSNGFSGSWQHTTALETAAPTASGQIPPTDAVAAPPQQSNWLPKVAVIGALAIAGGFLALRVSEKTTEGVRRDSPVATQQPLTGATMEAPALAGQAPEAADPSRQAPQIDPGQAATQVAEQAQHHAVITITSVPAGAKITADGKAYGETPADIEWWGELATPGREVTFTLQRDGYDKVTLVRSIKDGRLIIESTLPRARRRAAPDASRAGQRGPVVLPDDFKEDPY